MRLLVCLLIAGTLHAQTWSYSTFDTLASHRTGSSGSYLFDVFNDFGYPDQVSALGSIYGKSAMIYYGSALDDSRLFSLVSISNAASPVVVITPRSDPDPLGRQQNHYWAAGMYLKLSASMASCTISNQEMYISAKASDTQFTLTGYDTSACGALTSGTVNIICGGGKYGTCANYWDWDADVMHVAGDAAYMPYWKMGSAWDSATNRIRFKYQCDKAVPRHNPLASELSTGTFSRFVSKHGSNSQGSEWYTNVNINVYAGRPITLTASDQPDYSNDGNANVTPPRDPFRTHSGQSFFYDTNRFYLAYQTIGAMNCYMWAPEVGVINGEPDEYIMTLVGTYSGPIASYPNGRYEMSWDAQKGTLTYFDVRWSTSDIHTTGWNSATSLGSQVHSTRNTFSAVNWDGPDMAEQSTIYLAIRPTLPIAKVFAYGGQVYLELANGRDGNLTDGGRSVTISGIPTGKCAEANGTRTLTMIPRKSWTLDTGGPAGNQMSQFSISGGSTTTTVTLASAYSGIIPGQTISMWRTDSNYVFPGDPRGSGYGPWDGTASVQPDSTHVVFTSTGTLPPDGSTVTTSTGLYPGLWDLSASVLYAVDGITSCTGSFTATGGDGNDGTGSAAYVVSAENLTGFSQLQISAESPVANGSVLVRSVMRNLAVR